MHILFCNLSAMNIPRQIDQGPLRHKVGATAGPLVGRDIVTDSFESKVILGASTDKCIFITSQTATAVNGRASTTSITGFRDSTLLQNLKTDYIKKYGQEKWDTACIKAGGEEELFKLIRGFSANIATQKADYLAWHNNSPSVTGTRDANNDRAFSAQELRYDQAAQQIPQYCLPLKADGSIDFDGLPPPETPRAFEQIQSPPIEQTITDQPIRTVLQRPGYRFRMSNYAEMARTGNTVSFQLYFNDVTDGRARLASESFSVSFSLSPEGVLSAELKNLINGETYTYTDPGELRDLCNKITKDGMISQTGASTFADNGVSFDESIASFRPGRFNYARSSLNDIYRGEPIPIMQALYSLITE